MIKEIILASKNKKKVAELKTMLEGVVETITPLPDDYEDVEENGSTFEENAFIKARAAYRVFGKPVVADDSGLEVHALSGRPGIYSARYAENDAARIEKLLGELEGKEGSMRGANFKCVIALVLSENISAAFEGVVYGKILSAPVGNGGFGYDPIFMPNGYDKAFAEMSKEEKGYISHRGNAINKLKSFLIPLRETKL